MCVSPIIFQTPIQSFWDRILDSSEQEKLIWLHINNTSSILDFNNTELDDEEHSEIHYSTDSDVNDNINSE